MEVRSDNTSWQAAAMEGGSFGVWRWNVSTGEVQWSEGLAELFGLEREVQTFQEFQNLVYSEDLELLERALSVAMEQGAYACTFRVSAPDGLRWMEARGRLVSTEHGEVLLGSAQDVSERMRHQNAIMQIADGIMATRGEDFLFSLLSNLTRFLGGDLAFVGALEGHSVRTVALWDGGELGENFSYALAGTPCENVVGREYCIYPENVQELFPDDELLVEMGIEAYAGFPLSGDEGQPVGLVVVLWRKPVPDQGLTQSTLRIFGVRAGTEMLRLDVEEKRRRSVEELELNARALRLISRSDSWAERDVVAVYRMLTTLGAERLKSERVSIWTLGPDGEVLELVDLFERSTQHHASGMVLERSAFPEYFEGLQESRVIAAHDAVRHRSTCKLAQDYLIPMGITSMLDAPILLQGHTVGVLCCEHTGPKRIWTPEEQSFGASLADFAALALELQQRYRLEENLRRSQRMESIGRLAGGIAHDFNNLLTAISGCVELAGLSLPSEGTEDAERLLDEALDASERAAKLTEQLLAFARQRSVEARTYDVRQGVLGMLAMLRRLLGENIDLVTDLEPELWLVRMASALFEQVLVNLAINARDAMPTGGALRIEARNRVLSQAAGTLPAGDYVALRVKDTGRGMSRAEELRIFEPFYTTKTGGRGTGLGLATCYGIVEEAQGRITVESGVGKGTTFEVLLPRTQEPFAPDPLPLEQVGALASRDQERILLIEDDERILGMIQAGLTRLGYRVESATSGAEGLELVEGLPRDALDLVVTDVVMPGIQGREVARVLAEKAPELPVLLVSGSLEHRDEVNVHFLAKPYTTLSLARKIRQLLDDSGLS